MKYIASICLSTLFLLPIELHANTLFNGFSLDFGPGYRIDNTKTYLNIYDSPNSLFSSQCLNLKNIRSTEIVANAEAFFCERIGFKISYHKGFVHSGSYIESDDNIVGDNETTASVNSGDNYYFSISASYLYPLCSNLELGPSFGWSTDSLKVSIKDVFTNGIANNSLEDSEYKTKWQGLWAGLESNFYINNCFTIASGYEYHFPKWSGHFNLATADVFGGPFSDVRKTSHAYGNVFWLNSEYSINCQFYIDLLLKYSFWKAKNGSANPQNGSFEFFGGSENEIDTIPQVTWNSFEIALMLTYEF